MATTFDRLVAELRDQLAPKLKRKGRPPKRAGEAVAGVLAVIAGLKPSYLYDVGDPNPARLARAVEGIHTIVTTGTAAGAATPSSAASAISGPVRCPLCVLVLRNEPQVEGGDGLDGCETGDVGTMGVFVADRAALRAALLEFGNDDSDDDGSNDGSDHRLPMIDVSSGDAATQRFDEAAPADRVRLREIAAAIGSRLAAGTTTTVTTTTTDAAAAGACPVVTVSGEADWPFVALFGLFLGYPVLYTTGDAGSNNALGGRDLALTHLHARCLLEDPATAEGRELVAYTVPCELQPHMAAAVGVALASWRQRLETAGVSWLPMFSDVVVTVKPVNHPAVAL